MKEDTTRDRKSSKAAYALQLSTEQYKCLHSCTKVWFGLSKEVSAAISTPAFLCRRFQFYIQSTQLVIASLRESGACSLLGTLSTLWKP